MRSAKVLTLKESKKVRKMILEKIISKKASKLLILEKFTYYINTIVENIKVFIVSFISNQDNE